ncbi:MAG: hypothetical protein WEA24_02815 [Gemmatimonadota bacterium]
MKHVSGVRSNVGVVAACALLAGAALACGGNDPGGPDGEFPADLVGQWLANQACLPQGCAFTLYDVTNPADSLNIVSGSVSISMLVQSTGRIILTIPGFPSSEGTARVTGSRMYIEATQRTDTVDFAFTGGMLHLDFQSHFDNFDVDGDQVADLTRARAVFRRES